MGVRASQPCLQVRQREQEQLAGAKSGHFDAMLGAVGRGMMIPRKDADTQVGLLCGCFTLQRARLPSVSKSVLKLPLQEFPLCFFWYVIALAVVSMTELSKPVSRVSLSIEVSFIFVHVSPSSSCFPSLKNCHSPCRRLWEGLLQRLTLRPGQALLLFRPTALTTSQH